MLFFLNGRSVYRSSHTKCNIHPQVNGLESKCLPNYKSWDTFRTCVIIKVSIISNVFENKTLKRHEMWWLGGENDLTCSVVIKENRRCTSIGYLSCWQDRKIAATFTVCHINIFVGSLLKITASFSFEM